MYFLGASGIEADRLEMLSLQLLSSLSFSHSSRAEILRGFASDWSWVRWIQDRCAFDQTEPGLAMSERVLEMATMAIVCLGRFCAEKGESIASDLVVFGVLSLTFRCCQSQLWHSTCFPSANSCSCCFHMHPRSTCKP